MAETEKEKEIMKKIDVLTKAREVIADKTKWTVGIYALNDNDDTVLPHDKKACRFCSIGALYKASGEKLEQVSPGAGPVGPMINELDFTAKDMGYNGLIVLNDAGGHDNVLKMFDRTIYRLQRSLN